MDTAIISGLAAIQQRINEACLRSGRQPGDVQLLLATKTVPAERIQHALEAGYTLIAENRIQELQEKYEALQAIPHESHFIGHLQTNKIKQLLKYDVTCLQSLDRLELADKLDQRLRAENRTLDVLIQVNTSGEPSKFGIRPEEALSFVQQVAQYPQLRIKGLMTIGLLNSDLEAVRPSYTLLKDIQRELMAANIPGVSLHELSMGMSGDFETAIEEGATIVRVGTAIFGQRPTPDSFYWNEQLVPADR